MKLIDNREVLKFTASDRQLAGIYECKAANGVGEPAKAQIELNIICKIFFLARVECRKMLNVN